MLSFITKMSLILILLQKFTISQDGSDIDHENEGGDSAGSAEDENVTDILTETRSGRIATSWKSFKYR